MTTETKKAYHAPHLVRIRHSKRAEWTVISALQLELQDAIEALRALLAFWDRRDDSGWTAAEVERLAEIRTFLKRHGNI